MGAYWELHLPYIIYYSLINLLFRIENKDYGLELLNFNSLQIDILKIEI